MKKLLFITAALTTLAAPALAVELGKNLTLDSTVTAEYSVEASKFSALYEVELNYELSPSLVAYAYTDVDLRDADFTGLDLGLEYVNPAHSNMTFNAEVQLDDNLEYSDVILAAEVKF